MPVVYRCAALGAEFRRRVEGKDGAGNPTGGLRSDTGSGDSGSGQARTLQVVE